MLSDIVHGRGGKKPAQIGPRQQHVRMRAGAGQGVPQHIGEDLGRGFVQRRVQRRKAERGPKVVDGCVGLAGQQLFNVQIGQAKRFTRLDPPHQAGDCPFGL